MTAPHPTEAPALSDVSPPLPSGRPAARIEVLPDPLAPFGDPSRVRTTWPLFLAPEGADPDAFATPLAELLRRSVAAFAPGADQAIILKDNLLRLELATIESLPHGGPAPDGKAAMAAAGRKLIERLGLATAPSQQLAEQLGKLVATIPAGGRLLPYGRTASIDLFAACARHRLAPVRAALREEIRLTRAALTQMLEVDRSLSPEARSADALVKAVGEAEGSAIDADALSRILGLRRGSHGMSPERIERVTRLCASLDGALAFTEGPTLAVVHGGEVPAGWDGCGTTRVEAAAEPCAAAIVLFDGLAAGAARAFAALRAARLEIEGQYDPSRHDAIFASLDWMALTEAELRAVPAVVAVESADRVAAMGMSTLVGLLASGRPIQVLVEVEPTRNPGRPGGDPIGGYRVEIGLLGVSMRQVFVQQSTPARADHMARGLWRVLGAVRPGLHVVATGYFADGTAPGIGPWLAANAAVDGRAHPLFRYDPDGGVAWADCMDAGGNPDPDADWAADEGVENGDGPHRPFTFGDLALLDPGLHHHLRPPKEGEKVVALDAWLALPAGEAQASRPAVWGNASGRRFQLVVSSRLAFVARDRLRTWHMVRELGGISNAFARRAADEARAEADRRAQADREAIVAAHAAELDAVRAEAAGQAMERLARVLLDADLGALPTGTRPAPAAPTPRAAASPAGEPAATAAPAAPVEEEALVLDDPWIDSALCTSCNDCMAINAKAFVYNDSKQAIIGDASSATFAQLVAAAEKCPSRCIHPGKPKNPSEPNLAELTKRAAPFQ